VLHLTVWLLRYIFWHVLDFVKLVLFGVNMPFMRFKRRSEMKHNAVRPALRKFWIAAQRFVSDHHVFKWCHLSTSLLYWLTVCGFGWCSPHQSDAEGRGQNTTWWL